MSSDDRIGNFVGIAHEHRNILSPQVWGGFAIYPNSLRKGIFSIQDSPYPSMVRIGDEILQHPRFNSWITKLLHLEMRTRPDSYSDRVKKVFSAYDTKKSNLLYHHMNSFVLPPPWVIQLGEEYNLRLVTSIVDFQEHAHPEFLGPRIFEKRQQNYEITLGLATDFVTASPFLLDEAKKLFGIPPANITVAPLGWDHLPESFELEAFPIDDLVGGFEPYFIFPAKAWAHKGHIKLIETFGSATTNFKLLLVGSLGEQKEAIEKSIDESGKRDSIKVLGFLENLALYALIRRSAGLIFPSVYEGFGMPYVEAAHLKTPIVAFENESVNHLLGKKGAYLVDPEDYGALIESASYTLHDPERQDRIEFAWKKTENLTWQNTAQLTLDMYERAMHS